MCATTTANYSRRLAGELGQLTGVFEGAISVVRTLGIKYLWVDSLCIIQSGDDGADWATESTMMRQYYQNSLFTIAAASGTGDRGFLTMRPPTLETIVQLPYFEKGILNGHVYAFRKTPKNRRHVPRGGGRGRTDVQRLGCVR